jgi:hypothetical protein
MLDVSRSLPVGDFMLEIGRYVKDSKTSPPP